MNKFIIPVLLTSITVLIAGCSQPGSVNKVQKKQPH